MAAVTRTSSFPRRCGNMMLDSGTIEVNGTYTAYEVGGTSIYLLNVLLQDKDGTGSAEVDLNVNAAGTATPGTFAAVGNHQSTNTYQYMAYYV